MEQNQTNIKNRISKFNSNVQKSITKKEISFLFDDYILKFTKREALFKHISNNVFTPILNNSDMMILMYSNLQLLNEKVKREL